MINFNSIRSEFINELNSLTKSFQFEIGNSTTDCLVFYPIDKFGAVNRIGHEAINNVFYIASKYGVTIELSTNSDGNIVFSYYIREF